MSEHVSANRMNLLRLKRRVTTARRGHKLLKDKQDELVRIFFLFIKDIKGARAKLERRLEEVYDHARAAVAFAGPLGVMAAASTPKRTVTAQASFLPILNLRVPTLTITNEGPLRSWASGEAPPSLDRAAEKAREIFQDLVLLAELEHKVERVAYEIETTRRRVNALEYNLIPGLIENIHQITLKLSEMERSNLSRLMRLKEIVRGKS